MQITPMKKVFSIILALAMASSLALMPTGVRAEGKPDSANAPVASRLLLNYLCGNDTVILTATLGISKGDFPFALQQAEIDFTASGGGAAVPLGKAATDQEGIAVLKVPVAGLPAGKDGMTEYAANFAGNDKYPAAGATFAAKPARIRLSFTLQDSLRILTVVATQKDLKGETVPVAKETVLIYIPRLFSLLKIGEISLDENGTGTLEFPKEIVGDTLGNLTVLARIEEHDVFGFVQGQNVINWGVHKQYYKAEVPSRELWTPIAPLWMIITLIIMLAGVWAHYVYAVYELYMISRIAKRERERPPIY
jgi:hypothetical protein